MTEALFAISPGLLFSLVLWVIWFIADPPFQPEGLSLTRLLLWMSAPLAVYVVLATHSEPPAPTASPVGKEGTVSRLDPLQVEVFGSFWQARSTAPAPLALGDRIRVVRRDGLTLVVEPGP